MVALSEVTSMAQVGAGGIRKGEGGTASTG